MTRCARRILFAVVAAIALAAFTPAAQAGSKPRPVPMVAGTANYHGPEPGSTPIYDEDIVVMRRVMRLLVNAACHELMRGPGETTVYTCERRHSECHRGDSVPYLHTTGICSGTWRLQSVGIPGFPTKDCDISFFFFRRLESDGSTRLKRLPHSKFECAVAADA